MEAAALVQQAARYRPYFAKTGGITLTGGEPLMQVEFCLEVAKAARQKGIHLCLETAGQRWDAQVRALYEKVDLVLLRAWLPAKSEARNARMKGNTFQQSLAYFSAAGTPLWIRYAARDSEISSLPWDARGLNILRQEVADARHGLPARMEGMD